MDNKESRAFGSYQCCWLQKPKSRETEHVNRGPLQKLRRSELSHLSQVHPVSHWGPVYTKVVTGLFNQTPAISQKNYLIILVREKGK